MSSSSRASAAAGGSIASCKKKIPRLSRTRLQRVIRGECSVDGRAGKPSSVVTSGQRVTFRRPAPVEPSAPRELPILHADEAFYALDKPAGIAMHPTAKWHFSTVTAVLREKFPGEPLQITHRLDLETSGVLLVARTLRGGGGAQARVRAAAGAQALRRARARRARGRGRDRRAARRRRGPGAGEDGGAGRRRRAAVAHPLAARSRHGALHARRVPARDRAAAPDPRAPRRDRLSDRRRQALSRRAGVRGLSGSRLGGGADGSSSVGTRCTRPRCAFPSDDRRRDRGGEPAACRSARVRRGTMIGGCGRSSDTGDWSWAGSSRSTTTKRPSGTARWRRARGRGQILVCADYRRVPVFSPAAAESLKQLMAALGPRVERSAMLSRAGARDACACRCRGWRARRRTKRGDGSTTSTRWWRGWSRCARARRALRCAGSRGRRAMTLCDADAAARRLRARTGHDDDADADDDGEEAADGASSRLDNMTTSIEKRDFEGALRDIDEWLAEKPDPDIEEKGSSTTAAPGFAGARRQSGGVRREREGARGGGAAIRSAAACATIGGTARISRPRRAARRRGKVARAVLRHRHQARRRRLEARARRVAGVPPRRRRQGAREAARSIRRRTTTCRISSAGVRARVGRRRGGRAGIRERIRNG